MYANNMPLNSDKLKLALTARNKRIIKRNYYLNGAKSNDIYLAIYGIFFFHRKHTLA